MTRINIKMAPPTRLDRIWYRRINGTPPMSEGHYATVCGYFWLPCVLCTRPYGGHEAGKDIPDPTRGPWSGRTICSQCSRERPAEPQ